MRRFTDNTGRTWLIEITVATIKRVRALCDIDLLQAIDGNLLETLITDPITLCDCVYAICQPQAEEAGITDTAFGQAMAGDALEQATEMVLEELVDFFPQRRRILLRGALDKLKAVEAQALELAQQRLSDPTLDQQVAELLATLGNSSGTAPESSASNPTASPSAS